MSNGDLSQCSSSSEAIHVAHSPDLLKRLTAEPLHEDVRVEGVGRAAEETVNGGGVGELHISHFLEMRNRTEI